ncbi:hypothetical protein CIP107562_01970 [Corynebacterium diphtheriae]|nr:hypothetical protein CIP107562_01970 [Corynebacterium diphtheriae]
MFKRSLASLAVVAVASGAVVAPANAVTVTVNTDMKCTIQLTDEEAELTSLERSITADKVKAANVKEHIVESQLSTLRAEIAKYEQDLAKPGLDTEKEMALKSKLEEKRKQLTAYKNLSDALDACIAGHNYDSDQPGGSDQPGPNNPEGPSKPGPSKPGPSKPGPSKPGPSKPGPNNPERERALPSTNGAVIGVIVAVLGILVAALPVIKSMLPAQLRALLP